MDDEAIRRVFRERTPTSRAAHEAASEYLPGGDTRSVTYHRPYPAFAESGSGCTITTVDGEELLDFLNNYTQSILGHAPPAVVAAVQERFERGNGFAAPTRETTELARRLAERVPSVERVRFCNSGTEATMNAIRAAMAATGAETVLKVTGGYHGTHDTVEVGVSGEGREHVGIPAAVEKRVETVPFNDSEALKRAFTRNGDNLACFIVEPVMGVAGAIPATGEYLETARDLTADHEVPLIFDEVMTLRLAEGGAQERYGVTPDLTAMGKLIGGGLPVGAVGGRVDLMDVFRPAEGVIDHSGTFNANPTTMAAGTATLDALDGAAIERLNNLGDRLRTSIRGLEPVSPLPLTVTGDGSLFQLHLTDEEVTDWSSSTAGSEGLETLFLALRNRGVFMAPRGMGNLSSPMERDDIDTFVDALEAVLQHRK